MAQKEESFFNTSGNKVVIDEFVQKHVIEFCILGVRREFCIEDHIWDYFEKNSNTKVV